MVVTVISREAHTHTHTHTVRDDAERCVIGVSSTTVARESPDREELAAPFGVQFNIPPPPLVVAWCRPFTWR